MDHILQLHVEHHSSSSSMKHCESHPGVARLGKSADASRVVLAFAAIIASVALLFLPSLSSVVTARTALFVLSNAILLLLLAADCRWFFSISAAAPASDAVAVDACSEPEPTGDFLEKQHGRRHYQIQEEARQCAVKSCVPDSAGCLEHENGGGGPASEAFTETATISYDTDNTTAASEALVEDDQEEDAPVKSTPELPDLEELGIEELNKKFDEFIQSRRNKWLKEEACLFAA
ncbi:unnamed protein product [Urochloa humidicola]